jgi:hypothetical protein
MSMVSKLTDEYLLNNKDTILSELKDFYECVLKICGQNDETNTIPAKDLYERACADIVSCKNEISEYYSQVEKCEEEVEKEWDEFQTQPNRRW